MSEIMLASGFAQIVGLICNFKQERKYKSDDEYKEFQEWLSSRRHTEIQDLLSHNIELSNSIRHLLTENTNELLGKMDVLESALLNVGSKLDGLDSIAKHFSYSEELSEQAISMLSTVCECKGNAICELVSPSGRFLHVSPRNIQIKISEMHFIESDLDLLVQYGYLLPPKSTRKNERSFPVTRAAYKFIDNIVAETETA